MSSQCDPEIHKLGKREVGRKAKRKANEKQKESPRISGSNTFLEFSCTPTALASRRYSMSLRNCFPCLCYLWLVFLVYSRKTDMDGPQKLRFFVYLFQFSSEGQISSKNSLLAEYKNEHKTGSLRSARRQLRVTGCGWKLNLDWFNERRWV